MAMRGKLPELSRAMADADFVVINGVVFAAEYLRAPDEAAVGDDVVLEASHGDTEVAFTRDEMEGAVHVGEGVFRLRSGALLRFFSGATVH
jgi:hypothetical protein